MLQQTLSFQETVMATKPFNFKNDTDMADYINDKLAERQLKLIENKKLNNPDQKTAVTLVLTHRQLACYTGRQRVRAAFIESVITLLTRKGLRVTQSENDGVAALEILMPPPVLKSKFNQLEELTA